MLDIIGGYGAKLVNRNKVPVLGRRAQTHIGWGPGKRRLVAQSTKPKSLAPTLRAVRPHGQDLRLRRGVQEPGLGCRDQRPPCLDDGIAGLVARRLRPLWAALHPYGVA